MDPNERLTEQLRGELRRSLAQMRLDPELRRALKSQLLATPATRWPRWLGGGGGLARHGVLVGVAGVAAAGLAAAVIVPLVGQHPAPSSSRQYFTLAPRVNAGGPHSAAAAPASCGSAALRLTVTPARATLARGRSTRISIDETHGVCAPRVSVTGPAAVTVTVQSGVHSQGEASGVPEATFEIIWTGHTTKGGALPPGRYRVTVTVPSSEAVASATITVHG
ncbi:MAG TPA: hypothetical protein VNH82_11380 [Candidatus Dormibacteraeota bacterium]|nr:hypothetical protein [Candidatus Dormibacteraeota bacterium]